MIKIERTSVMNFENAIRGARNPMNSWDRMDSHTEPDGTFVFGENDLSLAKRLCKAGTDHRKFIRQIFVSVDLTAPIYWWKEFDTYKVGTVANSTSTMHKIQAKTFEEADFGCDRMVPAAKESLMQTIMNFTEKTDRQATESNPIVDTRLPDKSRVNVVMPPVALNGPIVTIRRFPEKPGRFRT